MSVGSRRALGSRYELVDRLGAGAMGEVWRAWDSVDEAYRAAKVLRSEYTSDPEILTRFIQERSILLGLDHENIVRVRDLVVEGDQLAIVMELVEGPSLRDYLRQNQTLAASEAVDVACAILEALVVAHAARALHRDIKPDNVLLARTAPTTTADVRLTDFGIARLAQESTVQATGLLGTPAYMPPELFEFGTFSASSDVYAVGVTLYEMLAGRTPFAGAGNAHTVGYRHLTALPPALPIPGPLWDVLSSMLAKDPTLRLTPAETAARLREIRPSLVGTSALPVQPEPSSWAKVEERPQPERLRLNEVPADQDVGATRLRGSQSTQETPIALEGEVRGFVDAPVADGVTQIRSTQPERAQAPVLESQLEKPRRSLKPVLLSVLGGVVAIGLVVALIVSGVFQGRPSATAPTQTSSGPVTVPNQDWPIGISQSNQASYDAKTGTVELQVTYTSPSVLKGAMLLVIHQIPSQGRSSACAGSSLTWQNDAGHNIDNSAAQNVAVPVSCGFLVNLSGTGTQTFSAHLTVSGVPSGQALLGWLQAINLDTANAIRTMNVQSASAFLLQSLTGVVVIGDTSVGAASGPVNFTVYPELQGQGLVMSLPLWHSPLQTARPNVSQIGIDPTANGVVQLGGDSGCLSASNGTVTHASIICTGTIQVLVGNLRSDPPMSVHVHLGSS